MEGLKHSAASVTVQVLQGNKGEQYKNPNDVVFNVKYPEGFPGNKIMPEGPVTVSKEAAAVFTAQGIGSIVTGEAEKEESGADEKAIDYSKLNKEQLKAELTSKGIAFEESATKPVLLGLLANDKKPGVTGEAEKEE